MAVTKFTGQLCRECGANNIFAIIMVLATIVLLANCSVGANQNLQQASRAAAEQLQQTDQIATGGPLGQSAAGPQQHAAAQQVGTNQQAGAKSNHRLVNKIKDVRHRRRHRHHRHRHLKERAAAAAAAAAATAAGPSAEQQQQAAPSPTALTALESIVEEVARAGSTTVSAQQQQQQQQQQQHQATQQVSVVQPLPQQAPQPTSAAVAPGDLLLDGSASPMSSASQSAPAGAPQPTPSVHQSPTGVGNVGTRGPLYNTRGFLLTSTLSKIYNLLNVTEFALEMRDGISSRASCVACHAVAGLFLSPLYSKEVFSAAMRTVCTSFKMSSARVCTGLIEAYQDDLEYIRKNTKLTRDEICAVVFGIDCARRQTYNLFWTVPIPEMPSTSPTVASNSGQIATSFPIGGGHTLTSMDDAPDLFEYRKSNVVSSSLHSSTQQPNHVRLVNGGGGPETAATAPTAASSSTNLVNMVGNQQASEPATEQNLGGKQHKLVANNAATPKQQQQQQKKMAKSIHRPQYIFDDDQLLDNQSDQTASGSERHSKQSSTFVQITDIHIDPFYEAGSLSKCNEPLCCRATSGPIPAPGDKRRQAGRWGDYGNCDVPVRTLRNALQRIRDSHPNAEYWIWTGDISPHDIWNITKAESSNHVRLVTKLVREYSNGLPVFPVIGNHEAHPVNSFPPPEIKGKFSTSWLYDLLAEQWAEWLPAEALKTLRIGGYYKLQVRRGFRIVALNTNYCARLNPWSFYDPVDPANQLKWLAEELLEAELNQDKVHIIGHVPPDHRECTQAWLFNFINIIDRFRDTVEAQFFGHTHRDEWRVVYSLARPDEPISMQFIGPSITPFTENNPAYRIYHQDKLGRILDSETYWFNLTEANETPTSEPTWRFSYSSRMHLNMTQGLTAQSWHHYLQKLYDDDDLFDTFQNNYYRSSDVKKNQVCRNKCKYQVLSDLRLSHPYKTKPKPFMANRKIANTHRDRHDHHYRRHRHPE